MGDSPAAATLTLPTGDYDPTAAPPYRVALCMIVKNEEAVIRRSTRSAKPYIDCFVIVDTGSTDGTIAAIYDEMRGIPGIVVSRPWVNFGANRTEAVRLVRGVATWAFMIDADDSLMEYDVAKASPALANPDAPPEGLTPTNVAKWNAETDDGYSISVLHGSLNHHRAHIYRVASEWNFVGAVHEYPAVGKPIVPGAARLPLLPGHTVLYSRSAGARSQDPARYMNDAHALLGMLSQNPADARSTFYLAQSFHNGGAKEAAVPYFRKRVAMGGWDAERYISLCRLIEIETADRDAQKALAWDAHNIDPSRLEAPAALFASRRMAGLPFTQEMYALGLAACGGPSLVSDGDIGRREVPAAGLFISNQVYLWMFDDEFSLVSYFTGHYADAFRAAARALAGTPEGHGARPRLEKNLDFCRARYVVDRVAR